ncbi:MAG: MBL fold metallo-hydrolase [Propionivibrio sp.]
MTSPYQILAVKYATVDRVRQSNFLKPIDGNPEAPMALDFFVWLVVGQGTVMLVDTGFSPASALVRQRQYLVSPLESLRLLGYRPGDVKDVVITHLHYDHAGNIGEFPDARVWVQDREVRYATGDCMCDPKQNHFFSTDDVALLIKRMYQGDVRLVERLPPAARWHRAAPRGWPHRWPAGGARMDRARLGGAGIRCGALPGEPRQRKPVPRHLQPRRHAAGIRPYPRTHGRRRQHRARP